MTSINVYNSSKLIVFFYFYELKLSYKKKIIEVLFVLTRVTQKLLSIFILIFILSHFFANVFFACD